MIDRKKENFIGNHVTDKMVFFFYFGNKADGDERKIATAILRLDGVQEQICKALLDQLHTQLNTECRTELVRQVFVDISRVYYPAKCIEGSGARPHSKSDGDINMDFYTDYLIKEDREGAISHCWGFICPCTLGRFSRKDKKFSEISNSMLSSCGIM